MDGGTGLPDWAPASPGPASCVQYHRGWDGVSISSTNTTWRPGPWMSH